jgi:hypothetical protein
LTTPYRFVALLSTIALAVGGTSAFAHGGGGGNGHGGGDNDNHQGSGKGGGDDGRHRGRLIHSDLFGSQPTGPTLFAVAPGGAPWVISRGEARVKRNGAIKVRVRGLVIPATPPATVATNPLPAIAATLFCNGQAVGTTAPFPFSPEGNARIEAKLDLSSLQGKPCLVPAVLLNPATPPTGGGDPVANTTRYIAATGA